MIEHELMLLGLLKERPKHGYEIKRDIKDILSLFAGVEPKSIYYPLRILEHKGLVIKHLVRQSRRPQRIVYKLTVKGENRFKELLTKSLLDFKRPQFSLDLSLYFLDYIKSSIAKRRLRGRMLILKKLSNELKGMVDSLRRKKSLSLACILEHDLEMVETEARFLNRFIKTL